MARYRFVLIKFTIINWRYANLSVILYLHLSFFISYQLSPYFT